MNLQVVVSLAQGPAAVKSTKLSNINPRSRVNEIKKQYLTLTPNYKLYTQFWSPQHKKERPG